MNDTQRKLFVDVVQLGSFSKAAQRHFVTPQSVSQQIKRLEGELGFSLLERTAQGVTPTEAGAAFCEGCERIDRELDLLVDRCARIAGAQREAIRLGSSSSYSLALFSRFVPQFLRSHPQERVEYVDVGARPVEGLIEGVYDVLEGIRPTSDALAFLPLMDSKRMCVIPPENPLSSRSVIEPEDLLGMNVYVYSLRWADKLVAYLAKRCPGVQLQEFPTPNFSSYIRVPEPERTVHLLPEQLTNRVESLIPVPLDVDVRTEYGLVYLPKNAARLHDLLEVAEACCKG